MAAARRPLSTYAHRGKEGVLRERLCIECGCLIPDSAPTKSRLCSDECREVRKRHGTISTSSRHQSLLRILDKEKIWRDPLRQLEIYEVVLAKGCFYCKANLLHSSGVCLDRVQDGKHAYDSTVPCCKTCNRLKSSGPGKHDGFTYTEMVEVIGPAFAEVRRRRESKISKQETT